jgi:hypothetical protein
LDGATQVVPEEKVRAFNFHNPPTRQTSATQFLPVRSARSSRVLRQYSRVIGRSGMVRRVHRWFVTNVRTYVRSHVDIDVCRTRRPPASLRVPLPSPTPAAQSMRLDPFRSMQVRATHAPPSTRLWLSTRATHALLIKLLSTSEPRCGSGKDPSRIELCQCTVQCTCQCQARRRDLGGLGLSKEGRQWPGLGRVLGDSGC